MLFVFMLVLTVNGETEIVDYNKQFIFPPNFNLSAIKVYSGPRVGSINYKKPKKISIKSLTFPQCHKCSLGKCDCKWFMHGECATTKDDGTCCYKCCCSSGVQWIGMSDE